MFGNAAVAIESDESNTGFVNSSNQVLLNTWVPICHHHLIKKKATLRPINAAPCYLWRDNSGAIHATEYHPELPNAAASFSKSPITQGTGRYTTMEAFGFLWLWYGYPKAADESLLPDIPYIPRAGGLPRYMHSTQLFRCSVGLAVENLLDLTHTDYLHTYVTGDEECESDEVSVEFTSETVTMIREQKKKKTPKFLRLMGVKESHVSFRGIVHVIVRSGVAHGFGRFTPGFTNPIFAGHTGESKMQTRWNMTINPWDSPALYKAIFPRTPPIVGKQDDFMFGPQNPRYLKSSTTRDLHSPFDGAGNRYRELFRKIATKQQAGDYSYAPDANVGGSLAELFQMKPL